MSTDEMKTYGIKKYDANKQIWRTVFDVRPFHQCGLIYIPLYNRLLIMGGTVNANNPIHTIVQKTNEIWILNPDTDTVLKSPYLLPIHANLKRRVAVICDEAYTRTVIIAYIPRDSNGEYQFLFPEYLINQVLQYLALYILHVFDENGDHYTANIDSLLQL